MQLNIGIVGKQDIRPEERKETYDRIKAEIDKILKKHVAKNFTGYTAMARGADTLFAEVVTKEFGQPLKIIMPFPAEEYRNNFRDPGDQQAFDKWITDHGVSEIINKGTGLDNKQKNEAYYAAGQYIVENCDEMIVVWDKLKPSGPGTTADILGLVAEKENSVHKGEVVPLNLIAVKPYTIDGIHQEIIRQSAESDAQARRLKKNYTVSWSAAIICGWLAAFCFAFNTAFHYPALEPTLNVAEFLLVIAVINIIWYAKQKGYHRSFIKQRLKREKLRLINVFYHINHEINLDELKIGNDQELDILIDDVNNEVTKQRFVSPHYTFYCIQNLIGEQLKYHTAFLSNSQVKKIHTLEWLRKGIVALFLLNLLQHVFHSFHITPGFSEEFSIFLGIALPACFGAIEAWLNFMGWEILKSYSVAMKKDLEDAKLFLARSRNDAKKLAGLLIHISVKMLTDNRHWHSIIRGKPEEIKLF